MLPIHRRRTIYYNIVYVYVYISCFITIITILRNGRRSVISSPPVTGIDEFSLHPTGGFFFHRRTCFFRPLRSSRIYCMFPSVHRHPRTGKRRSFRVPADYSSVFFFFFLQTYRQPSISYRIRRIFTDTTDI